jgi:Na+-transporting NADH:ubiquinone oxidoreductase subunit NqrB
MTGQFTKIRDPRSFQSAILIALLAYGAVMLDFEVRSTVALAIAVSALGWQFCFSKLWGPSRFDPRSAVISALSLCLLLRTTSLTTALLAAFLAIGSKFVLRHRGKHWFNPTAFGLAGVLLLRDDAWVSAGQWGTAPWLALALVGMGSLIVRRAERSDVTWAFLGSYLVLLLTRSWWLGDPLAVPLHALQSGALLIFAFFMISDPRTTPDSRVGRIAFGCLVAATALFARYGLYQTNGLIWSLVICSLLIPGIDRVFPGRRYRWRSASQTTAHGGNVDDAQADLGALLPGLRHTS